MEAADEIGLVVCSSAWSFGNKILGELERICAGTPFSAKLIDSETVRFGNTEIKTRFNESVSHYRHLFIIQDCENHYPRRVNSKGVVQPSTVEEEWEPLELILAVQRNKAFMPSSQDNERELKTAVSAARASRIKGVTVIVPSHPYARQDKKKEREGITAMDFARELKSYEILTGVITQDLHNTAIEGFYGGVPLQDLHASESIIKYLNLNLPKEVLDNLRISQIDIHGSGMSSYYARKMGKERVPAEKIRDYSTTGQVERVIIYDKISGCYVLIPDDMGDTLSSLEKYEAAAAEKGALGIYAAFSLGLFNPPAVERANRMYDNGKGLLKGVVSTNAVYHPPYFYEANPWLTFVPMEQRYAELIFALHQDKSVSHLLE